MSKIKINKEHKQIDIELDTLLLRVLREYLNLVKTKVSF